jgi:hypothetical protein
MGKRNRNKNKAKKHETKKHETEEREPNQHHSGKPTSIVSILQNLTQRQVIIGVGVFFLSICIGSFTVSDSEDSELVSATCSEVTPTCPSDCSNCVFYSAQDGCPAALCVPTDSTESEEDIEEDDEDWIKQCPESYPCCGYVSGKDWDGLLCNVIDNKDSCEGVDVCTWVGEK